MGLMVLKTTGFNPGFNAKIGLEEYAPSPEILVKTSQNIQVWFREPNFGIF